MSSGVLLFTAAAALATGLLSGLVPAMQAGRLGLSDALKAGVREGLMRRSRTQSALVLTQGTLSVVLLVGAGLFVRSIRGVESIDLGMDSRGVLIANVELDDSALESEELFTIYEQSAERLGAVPAVEHAGVGTAIPFRSQWAVNFAVPGIDSLPKPARAGPFGNAVSPDFFAALGMRFLSGRGFGPTDVAGSARVGIINEAMARAIWPTDDAIGQCMLIGEDNPPCTTVVGIVADSHVASVEEGVKWQYFLPLSQRLEGDTDPTLFVRARTDSDQLEPLVQRELLSAIPGARYVSVRRFQDLIDRQIRSYSLGATMFSVFGVLALIVAGIGLYSVLAFGVAQRTHEIGVRTALGASQNNIVAMILKQAVGLTAAAVVIGLLIAVAAGSRIAGLLYEVSPGDPLVLGIVMFALLIVAVLAGVIPASRAARVNPIDALRAD